MFDRRTLIWTCVALVVAVQIPYPLVHGKPRNALTIAVVLVFAATSIAHSWLTRGGVAATALVAVFGVGGFAVEVLGVHTGVPFGDYRYASGLGPHAFGVPLLIGLAWLMMAEPACCVARCWRTAPAQVAVAAVALAGWDVYLDPQMVQAGHWRWTDTSPHLPGVNTVPLTNFAGWLLVALVLMSVQHAVDRRAHRDDAPMVALWVWTWLGSALAAVFAGRYAGAGWGLIAMGIVGVPLLLRLRSATRLAQA